jgi:membrane-bound ClpP family serine protease
MDFMDFEWTGPIIIAIVLAVAFIIFIIYAIVKGQRLKLSAGIEDMTLDPKGTVLAEGELWTAIAEDSKIEAGEEVTITKIEGLKLWVTRKPKE